ncbi:MAG TPA: aromatic amino acid lyase, partial [Ktedonobacteraceae bacterium]
MKKTERAQELPSHILINGQALSSAQVLAVARHNATVSLGSESISRIQAARAVIDTLTAEDQKVYG